MSAAGASAEGLTKSAKKRMAQKAKAAAAEAEPEAKAAPAPKAAAAAPKAAAEPEKPAAAKSKAKAKAAEPKAAAAKAAAKAEPAAVPAQAEPKAEAKAEPKAKGKAKAKKAPTQAAVPPPVKKDELPINTFLDDGTGGDWETTATTKKQKKEKKEATGAAVASDPKATTGKALPSRPTPAVPEDQATRRQTAREKAEAEVARILGMKSEEPSKPAATAHSDSIIVPEPKIGIVIGPKGSTIQLIQEKSKCGRIDTSGGVFTISGEEDAVKMAKGAIQDIIDCGFCKLAYDDFSEGSINAHPQYFPDIIGSRGSVINEIKKQLKVEISMPELPQERKADQKFKIKIAGETKQVEQAKECINNIMMYQHSDVTHPGQTHAELEVEQWAYSFIIGRGGSEMKHIQKNWEVKVAIPREQSMNQKVLIVGMPDNVERAKAYMDKLIFNAENITKSNPRDKPEEVSDKWVDKDDIVEPGLEGYIVKRS